MTRRPARSLALTAFALCAWAPAAAEVNVRGQLDLGELARCISDSGATFYGAHWCPVCRRQKESFEQHAWALPYVECYDGPKSAGMNAQCKNASMRSFPTWVFANGRAVSGLKTPLELALATRCLPR